MKKIAYPEATIRQLISFIEENLVYRVAAPLIEALKAGKVQEEEKVEDAQSV